MARMERSGAPFFQRTPPRPALGEPRLVAAPAHPPPPPPPPPPQRNKGSLSAELPKARFSDRSRTLRALLVTPPSLPPRFPRPRLAEMQRGVYREDPRHFGPPPRFPFPCGGAEMVRPRFPYPRNRFPQPGASVVHPLPPCGPGFRCSQPPSSPNEALRPQFHLEPIFRPPFPPRPLVRAGVHHPGFSPGEFQLHNQRPEECFNSPRPNFVPRCSFDAISQCIQPSGFLPKPLDGAVRMDAFSAEHHGQMEQEYDAGSWEAKYQDWPTWNGKEDCLRQQFHSVVSTQNYQKTDTNFLPAQPSRQQLENSGEITVNPRQIQYKGRVNSNQLHGGALEEFRTEENCDWTEINTNGERFHLSDSSYFEQQQQQQQPAVSGSKSGWVDSLDTGERIHRDIGRKKHEVRKAGECESGENRRGNKRKSSRLDNSPLGKRRRSFSRERSPSDRELRFSGSRSMKSRGHEDGSRANGSRHRRSSGSNFNAPEKSANHRFSCESSFTSENYDESDRKVYGSNEKNRRSRNTREDSDRTLSSRLRHRHSVAQSPRPESRNSSESLRSGNRRERSRNGSLESRETSRQPRRHHSNHQLSSSPLMQQQQQQFDSSVSSSKDLNPLDETVIHKQQLLEDHNQEKRLEEEEEDEEEAEVEEEEEERIPDWIRCSPADLYFKRDRTTGSLVSTNRMLDLEKKVEYELLCRAERVKASRPPVELPLHRPSECEDRLSVDDVGSNVSLSEIEDLVIGDDDDEEEEEEDDDDGKVKKKNQTEEEESVWVEELNWKRNHPEKLHDELWFNLPGEMNDGPLCRCCGKSKSQGIRHNIYPGEEPIPKCDPHTNNQDQLFHYRITMSPHTNFLTKNPTLIEYDSHEYIFEGFSVFSHYRIGQNFDVHSLDLFADFLYREVLELVDLDWAGKAEPGRCRPFHIMPRFARDLPDNGKEILSMNEVLNFLLRSCRPLLEEMELANMLTLEGNDWQNVVDEVRGMIVTYPGMRPSSLRIDQLDREQKDPNIITYPKIIHFGLRPAQLSYAGDPKYKKLWKHYMKLKHLVANKPKASANDKEKMRTIEDQLQEIRLKGSMKREMTVEISSEGFIRTGIKSDICQHALLLPVLIQHLRFHRCLNVLEKNIKYQFKDRLLLELAMTHPSYRTNYGTNPDHARNSLTNCGFRQLEYGDRQIHYVHRRKRGINVLMHIMSKLAKDCETPSEIHHYERLEFLGDSVIEFLSSIHLFFMFPRLEEGGLATYRAALVQNQFLTVLAEKIGLHHFMLYAHGPDLCLDLDLRYAMANCFEALMGSLFLDGGVDVVDKVYGEALFKDEPDLLYVWSNLPRHPLQEDEPNGDRHWIPLSPPLKKLMEFEKTTGIVFNHIRLLARAFTMRNIGFNNLTLGHNQTLEFLGDTVLQFISSEYLFKHFPDHHEGHLTLLRTSLVNHRTQATICDDLGMTEYVINNDKKVRERMENEKNKVKDKADILEAFLGALYVDQGLEACKVLAEVCFYPRLREFIMNQDWNDAKSQLQQCCLTLRDPSDGDPDIPVYKVLQCTGPTNTRKYHVAVYFRGDRLGTGIGHSIQRAEMNAAANALKEKQDMFPHLLHVQHFLDRRFGKRRKKMPDQSKTIPSQRHRHRHSHDGYVQRHDVLPSRCRWSGKRSPPSAPSQRSPSASQKKR